MEQKTVFKILSVYCFILLVSSFFVPEVFGLSQEASLFQKTFVGSLFLILSALSFVLTQRSEVSSLVRFFIPFLFILFSFLSIFGLIGIFFYKSSDPLILFANGIFFLIHIAFALLFFSLYKKS